jgi:hypothetical protein
MSEKRLRIWVFASIAWLLVYAIAFAYCRLQGFEPMSEILKILIPVAIAVPSATLAAAFTRRNSYLQGLRELWKSLIPAAQSAIQYTHLAVPDQVAFAKTQEALSIAIDLLRGVFGNVPAKGTPSGLFPFENLKDIQKIISWLGFGGVFKTESSKLARQCITRLWQEMHLAMLSEFDRDIPARPVSKYLGDGDSLADLLINETLKPKQHLDKSRRASNPNAA